MATSDLQEVLKEERLVQSEKPLDDEAIKNYMKAKQKKRIKLIPLADINKKRT